MLLKCGLKRGAMEKVKLFLLAILAGLISFFTMDFIKKSEREAKKKAINDRKKNVNDLVVEFEEIIDKEKKDDESKSIEEISSDVDDLLDD